MAKSLDTVVRKAVEEYVEDATEKAIEKKNQVEEELQEIDLQQYSREDEPQQTLIDDLLATIPRSEGFYIKLYKEIQSGKFEYKERIDDYEHWTDLESEVVNIVKAKTAKYGKIKWGSGKYKVMVFKEGERGFHRKPITFLIDADDTEFTPQNQNDFQYKLQEMGNFMKQIKEVTQSETPQSDPSQMSKMIADSFKQGIDTVKAIMPQTAEKPTNNFEMMLAMLKVLKETEKPKEDPFEMLLKMKQLGMINLPNENTQSNDPISQVSKIGELMQVMAPLMGNAPVEQPSAWMKLVEIVAPAIPQIISNVTQAVTSVTELSKAKLSASLGVPLPQSAPSQIGGTPLPPQQIAIPPIQPTQKNNEVKEMNPIVKQIYQAVKSKNSDYYPQIKNLIDSWVNPYIVTELREGRVQVEDFLSQAGVMLGETWFTEDDTKSYFDGFVDWCKSEHLKNIVVVKCNKCNDYFDVPKSEYKHDDKCDCGGILEAVSNNGAITEVTA